jgi:hypothetical protein
MIKLKFLSPIFYCSILFFASCGNDCKSLSGNTFIQVSTGNRYSYATSYKFSGSSVSLLAMTKIGSDEFKKTSSQEGSYSIDGDKVKINFGGSDVYLDLNKSSEGCIEALSNQFGLYERAD